MAEGPFVKVYQLIVDDPMFERVFDNDHALAAWLRMLLVAEAMYPVSAPMPPRNPTVRLLIDCGLVIEKPGNRYSIRGQEAERERRSNAGRNAAAVRWQRVRNADPLLTEKRREEKSNGQSPSSFIRYSVKEGAAPGEAFLPRHDGRHKNCAVCKAVMK